MSVPCVCTGSPAVNAPAVTVEVLTGLHRGQSVTIDKPRFKIGASADSDLRLASHFGPGLYVTISVDADGAEIHDCSLLPAARVNTARAGRRQRLQSGDMIEVASTLLRVTWSPAPQQLS
ncbi:MAG: hypothetical protein CMJ47_01340 [Planctomyces sp.]|nr:hypothetical protein [Planctomyces sp.]